MKDSSFGIALIGCGAITKKGHVPGLVEGPLAWRGACDLHRDQVLARVETAREEFGDDAVADVATTTDHHELLARDDIHVVDIATPPMAHTPLVLDALAAGKHVLCEKPSALDVQENKQVLAALEGTNLTVQYYSSRFRSNIAEEARTLIAEGGLGRILRVDVQFWGLRGRACDKPNAPLWFGDKRLAGGGAFMDMGQYFLDQAFHILGWPKVLRVTASDYYGTDRGLHPDCHWDVEDHMAMQADLADNICLTLDTTQRVNQHWRWGITFMGTEGCLQLDRTADVPWILRRMAVDGTLKEERRNDFDKQPRDIDRRLEAMADILNRKESDPAKRIADIGTDAHQALFIGELCDRAYRSAAEQRPIIGAAK